MNKQQEITNRQLQITSGQNADDHTLKHATQMGKNNATASSSQSRKMLNGLINKQQTIGLQNQIDIKNLKNSNNENKPTSRGISKNSNTSNISKGAKIIKQRAVPSNLASNRSLSFVSRKALGDISSKENIKRNVNKNEDELNQNGLVSDKVENLNDNMKQLDETGHTLNHNTSDSLTGVLGLNTKNQSSISFGQPKSQSRKRVLNTQNLQLKNQEIDYSSNQLLDTKRTAKTSASQSFPSESQILDNSILSTQQQTGANDSKLHPGSNSLSNTLQDSLKFSSNLNNSMTLQQILPSNIQKQMTCEDEQQMLNHTVDLSFETNQIKLSKRTMRSRQRNHQKIHGRQVQKVDIQQFQTLQSLNQSLADQRIEESFAEDLPSETVQQIQPSFGKTDAEKIADFQKMLKTFYNSQSHDMAKSGILPVDVENIADTQFIGEYSSANQTSMQKDAIDMTRFRYPSMNCLANQQEINQKMRRILVDWLIDVHLKFKLLPETLFQTINMIDRYCQLHQVKRKNYQLLGVTSMLIAAKYEEIYPPFIRDFIYITDKAYTKEQILQQETLILQSLDFDLTYPSAIRFLERYGHLSDCDAKLFSLARYMLELSLVEISMNKWNPSLLVCSAIFVSKKILERRMPWSRFMSQQTGHQEKDVRQCAKELCFIINIAHDKRHFHAAFKKYSLPKYYSVAEICKNLSESIQNDENNSLLTQASTPKNLAGQIVITPFVSNRPSMEQTTPRTTEIIHQFYPQYQDNTQRTLTNFTGHQTQTQESQSLYFPMDQNQGQQIIYQGNIYGNQILSETSNQIPQQNGQILNIISNKMEEDMNQNSSRSRQGRKDVRQIDQN